MTTIGSLFSGAGGLDLAVQQVFGGDILWHCENDPAATKVLAAHWPDTPNLGDITQVDWNAVEPADILCGGFPCQDVSAAGRRAGIHNDSRSGLWTYMADAIAALQPSTVIIENVSGLLSARAHRVMERNDPIMGDNPDGFVLRAAGAVLGDLADLRYDAQWTTVAASSVGAPHRRERVFILASDTEGARRGIRNPAHVGSASREVDALRNDCVVDADSACDGRHQRRPEPARQQRGSDATVSGARPVELLPTPMAHDAKGTGPSAYNRNTPELSRIDFYLPTPTASDGDPNGGPNTPENRLAQGHHVQLIDLGIRPNLWGKYEPAIRRWEHATRPAPPPTQPNTKGNPRLAAAFSEWMMGWPHGWVTTVPGISRNDALRIIGNGVVPQQATTALRWLLTIAQAAA